MRSRNSAIVLLACTLVILQGTNAKTTKTTKNSEEDIQNAIAQQNDALKEVTEAYRDMNHATSQIQNTWKKELKLRTAEFKEIKAESDQKVDNAKKRAEEQGVDIENCERIYDLVMDKDYEETAAAVDKSVLDFLNAHYSVEIRIREKWIYAGKKLEGYELDAWLCENDLCLEEVMKKLHELPAVMVPLLNEIDAEITDINKNGPVVISNGVTQYQLLYSRMGKYIYKFKVCVDLKLD